MQYGQRKLQRSVTEIRRSRIGRPRLSSRPGRPSNTVVGAGPAGRATGTSTGIAYDGSFAPTPEHPYLRNAVGGTTSDYPARTPTTTIRSTGRLPCRLHHAQPGWSANDDHRETRL